MSLNSQALAPPAIESISWLVETPLAHRGYHNADDLNYENTVSAWQRAIDHGFSIEADLQITADGKAVVFHDSDFLRMTGNRGLVRKHTAAELSKMQIMDGSDTIRTLDEHLELVDGKVPLLLELKGIPGEDNGLVKSVAKSLENYPGPVAIMSFNHWLAEQFVELIPDRPRGLTAMGNENCYDFHMNAVRDFDIHFISYRVHDLPCRFVADVKMQGMPIITWTVRTSEECEISYKYADQITFEGFDPNEQCA